MLSCIEILVVRVPLLLARGNAIFEFLVHKNKNDNDDQLDLLRLMSTSKAMQEARPTASLSRKFFLEYFYGGRENRLHDLVKIGHIKVNECRNITYIIQKIMEHLRISPSLKLNWKLKFIDKNIHSNELEYGKIVNKQLQIAGIIYRLEMSSIKCLCNSNTCCLHDKCKYEPSGTMNMSYADPYRDYEVIKFGQIEIL